MRKFKITVILMFFVFNFSINLKSEENLSILYIDNNYNYDNLLCEKNSDWFLNELSFWGHKYFGDLDTNKYKGKKLGYIITDLEQSYRLLSHKSGNTFTKCEPSDWFIRSEFIFNFEFDNYNLLVVEGCININNTKSIEDDEKAFEFLCEQKEYIVYFYKIDLRIFYDTVNPRLEEFEGVNNVQLKLIKEYFPHIIQEYEEKNKE